MSLPRGKKDCMLMSVIMNEVHMETDVFFHLHVLH